MHKNSKVFYLLNIRENSLIFTRLYYMNKFSINAISKRKQNKTQTLNQLLNGSLVQECSQYWRNGQ